MTGGTIVTDASDSTTKLADQDLGAPEESRIRRPVADRFEAFALPALLVLAALFFTVYGPTSNTFLTTANIQVLLGGQAVVALVALALLVPLCANEWDLSVGGVAGLSATFAASVMSSGSLMGGLLMFGGLFLAARWATATDPEILRILLNSARFRTHYDPAKFESSQQRAFHRD